MSLTTEDTEDTEGATPETDAAERMAFSGEHMVPTDFARKLERERDEAREEIRNWQTLRIWGAEPEFIHDFIKRQQTSLLRSSSVWIPVSQALPDDDATVLVHMDDGEVWTGFVDAGTWRFVSGDRIESPVLHWRPFPDPPKP